MVFILSYNLSVAAFKSCSHLSLGVIVHNAVETLVAEKEEAEHKEDRAAT